MSDGRKFTHMDACKFILGPTAAQNIRRDNGVGWLIVACMCAFDEGDKTTPVHDFFLAWVRLRKDKITGDEYDEKAAAVVDYVHANPQILSYIDNTRQEKS